MAEQPAKLPASAPSALQQRVNGVLNPPAPPSRDPNLQLLSIHPHTKHLRAESWCFNFMWHKPGLCQGMFRNRKLRRHLLLASAHDDQVIDIAKVNWLLPSLWCNGVIAQTPSRNKPGKIEYMFMGSLCCIHGPAETHRQGGQVRVHKLLR